MKHLSLTHITFFSSSKRMCKEAISISDNSVGWSLHYMEYVHFTRLWDFHLLWLGWEVHELRQSFLNVVSQQCVPVTIDEVSDFMIMRSTRWTQGEPKPTLTDFDLVVWPCQPGNKLVLVLVLLDFQVHPSYLSKTELSLSKTHAKWDTDSQSSYVGVKIPMR